MRIVWMSRDVSTALWINSAKKIQILYVTKCSSCARAMETDGTGYRYSLALHVKKAYFSWLIAHNPISAR